MSAGIVAAAEAPAPLTVESFDNHLYFYSDVNEDRCLDLTRRLREVDARLRSEALTRNLPKDYPATPIWLHVQSYGGYVFAGFAAANQIKQLATPVWSVVEGVCASAATLLSLACPKRYILPDSFILIHQASTFFWGKYDEMKDEMKLMDQVMAQLVDFYQAHTKLKRKEIKAMLKHETWISAQDALKMGIVDEVLR